MGEARLGFVVVLFTMLLKGGTTICREGRVIDVVGEARLGFVVVVLCTMLLKGGTTIGV